MRKTPKRGRENSVKNSEVKRPVRDAAGRLRGGNSGNRGGRPGRSGRPRSALRQWCRDQLLDPVVQSAIARTVRDPDARNFTGTLTLMFRYAEAPPASEIRLSGLPLIAARIEGLPDAELQRLLRASDEELDGLLGRDDDDDE
jgi:hypothetical protein